ncbi:helix-turn-helix domain-containing protein [Enterococcus sp. 669A]|uniref:Helix-turn-helix domain-containing protein n=1 Tax=Candidatus Enterococcus moelleringii TaxID=2815325 RepID=A0ABS3L6K5_9ENTE|nr:helix-turn-helix domain-containing protein [Enterococcus sp. 669A]MBO1305256.1 helix-turn-helix domain-containing protein [Enterococcus sp. 669A]
MQTQEAVQKFLLPKQSVKKIEIIQFLLKNQQFYNTNYLATRFEVSTTNFLRYSREIKEDILAVNSNLELVNQKGLIRLYCSNEDFTYQFHLLFSHYCQQATNYRIGLALLNREVTSVLKLSQATSYSPSYIYSRMKDINAFLQLYGVGIRFSNDGEKQMLGTEFQIIYCILDVHWSIFSSTKLPFNATQEEKESLLNKLVKKDVLQSLNGGLLHKLYDLLLLCTKYYPYTSFQSIREEIEHHSTTKIFQDPGIDILKACADLSQEQRIIINVLSRLAITKVSSLEETQHQYEILRKGKFTSFEFSEKLLTEFCRKFTVFLPEDRRNMHILNLLRNKLYNEYLCETQPSTPMPSYSLYQDQKNFNQIKDDIQQFYLDFRVAHQELLPKLKGQENIVWIVEALFHIYVRYKAVKPIIVGVNYTKDYYVSEDIIAQIEKFFSPQQIHLQKNHLEDCDIVITDAPVVDLPQHIKRIYLLGDAINRKDWEQLFAKIGTFVFEHHVYSFE